MNSSAINSLLSLFAIQKTEIEKNEENRHFEVNVDGKKESKIKLR